MRTILISTACFLAAATATATRPTHDEMIAVFGTLHAHSTLSGDVKTDKGLGPEGAFEYARTHGLDFLGISDHHKPSGAPGGPRFHLTGTTYKDDLFDVAARITDEHAGTFVAIPGIEWGTIGTGNHVNIFGSLTLPPESIKDDEYKELYTWVENNAKFAQWNHPYSWANKSTRNRTVGNYGKSLYGSTAEFLAASDPAVQLMSIVCTVWGGHISGKHAHSVEKTHRDHKPDALRIYQRHLNMGHHLSPSANQDTHGKNPGTVTAARTGVWVESLTLDEIADAVQANRVFATEDDELAVALQVRYAGETYWMGETVPLADEEAEVVVILYVSQSQGSDGDDRDEGPYLARLFSDADGIGGQTASEWDAFELSPSSQTVFEFPVSVVVGEYIYFEISETNGGDNPVGDGLDEFSTDGSEQPDGERDNLNDQAWTSPIWFSDAAATVNFVWSKRSSVYHDLDCFWAQRIGEANRREGPAPEGKRKHDCHE